MEKICTKCGISKSFDDYYRDKRGAFGLYAKCKECHNKVAKNWKISNPEKVISIARRYYAINRERMLSYGRKWEKENPDKLRIRRQRNYWKNPEKFRAAALRYRDNNYEAYAERGREYRKQNLELCRERHRKYRRNNPEVFARLEVLRRAAKEQATPKWANRALINEIYKVAKMLSEEFGKPMHVDHIVPLRGKLVSGLHCESNLRIISAEENYRKNNKIWPDMP